MPMHTRNVYHRAANYCRTSDNVRLNLANVRAKVILIGHWSDHKKNCHIHFFRCVGMAIYTNLSRDLYISCDVYMSDQLSDVGFCPTKFKLCPTKIKSDRTNVLSSQIFICSPGTTNRAAHYLF